MSQARVNDSSDFGSKKPDLGLQYYFCTSLGYSSTHSNLVLKCILAMYSAILAWHSLWCIFYEIPKFRSMPVEPFSNLPHYLKNFKFEIKFKYLLSLQLVSIVQMDWGRAKERSISHSSILLKSPERVFTYGLRWAAPTRRGKVGPEAQPSIS